MCTGEGQIYTPCGGSCETTCEHVIHNKPIHCTLHCIPGCTCPGSQVN